MSQGKQRPDNTGPDSPSQGFGFYSKSRGKQLDGSKHRGDRSKTDLATVRRPDWKETKEVDSQLGKGFQHPSRDCGAWMAHTSEG